MSIIDQSTRPESARCRSTLAASCCVMADYHLPGMKSSSASAHGLTGGRVVVPTSPNVAE